MKNTFFIIIVVVLNSLSVNGQTKKERFDHYELSTKKIKSFTIHITRPVDSTPKPLLVYLDGSGNYPLFYKTKKGYSTSVSLDVNKYAKDYYVVLISKPGIPFIDSLQYTESGRSFYPPNQTYTDSYSMDWRAETASAAIDFLVKKLPINRKKIIVMGYSEGSQVAPKVAMLNKKVTHVVCIVGNAQNQLYDFIVDARLQVEKGKISATEGQQIVDSLYGEYEKIYADPQSTEKKWYGETYLKWSSFTQTTPLESMLKLTVPILYIAGGSDSHQTIIDMDYAKLEFMRKGKHNLMYKVYPNANHYFQETTTFNGETKTIDRSDEVHQFAIDWVNTQ